MIAADTRRTDGETAAEILNMRRRLLEIKKAKYTRCPALGARNAEKGVNIGLSEISEKRA